MNSIQFKNLDFNLFKVLLALLDHRSVTRAAEELSLTPSAVSHALNRLRTALNDPLFERGGGGLVPTAHALEIGRRVRPAVTQLRAAVDNEDFDPQAAEREFVVAAGAYATAVILPRLIDRLALSAPNIRVRVRRLEEQSVDDLEHGRFDFLVGAPGSLTGKLEWRPLLTDEMVWIARAGHPFVRAPLTMDMLVEARHVIIEKFGNVVSPAYPEIRRFFDETPELRDASAAAAGRSYRKRTSTTGAIVTDTLHAIAMVARSDLVSLTLRRMVEAYPGHLQILDPPHDTPTIEIGAIHLPSRSRDPGFLWLMNEIGAVISASGPAVVGSPVRSAIQTTHE